MGQSPVSKWEGLKTCCTAVHYSFNVQKECQPILAKRKWDFDDEGDYLGYIHWHKVKICLYLLHLCLCGCLKGI